MYTYCIKQFTCWPVFCEYILKSLQHSITDFWTLWGKKLWTKYWYIIPFLILSWWNEKEMVAYLYIQNIWSIIIIQFEVFFNSLLVSINSWGKYLLLPDMRLMRWVVRVNQNCKVGAIKPEQWCRNQTYGQNEDWGYSSSCLTVISTLRKRPRALDNLIIDAKLINLGQ